MQSKATSTLTNAYASEWFVNERRTCCLFCFSEVISTSYHCDSPALSAAPTFQSNGKAFTHGDTLRMPTVAVKSWSATKRIYTHSLFTALSMSPFTSFMMLSCASITKFCVTTLLTGQANATSTAKLAAASVLLVTWNSVSKSRSAINSARRTLYTCLPAVRFISSSNTNSGALAQSKSAN